MREPFAFFAILVVGLLGCSSRPTTKTPSKTDAPTWFVGAWKLEWARVGKTQIPPNQIVRDLQTPTVFGSVRIKADRPAFPNATSFDDLDDAGLAVLLDQRGGFAGTASFAGDVATWNHDIDFQPPGADTARLRRTGPRTVLEEALDGSFSELWWSMSSGDNQLLGIQVTRAGRVEKILTVVGDHFVFARNRARDLPAGAPLKELVANTKATRAQIIELLDCELSYGLVNGGRVPWEVRFSTLPWREGKPLAFAREVAVGASGALGPRTPSTDVWTVAVNTMTRDDLAILFTP